MSFVSLSMNPVQTNGSVRREIERLLQDVVPVRTFAQTGPAANGYEDAAGFTMEFDVPGFAPDALEVLTEDGALLVRGSRPAPEFSEDTRLLFAERPTGSFERRMRLPKTADATKISANYTNGVLIVKVAKLATVAPRKIAINVGESGQAHANQNEVQN